MKVAGGARSDRNAAANILIAVLLGCLAISAHCGRVLTDLAGERGEAIATAGHPGDERPPSAIAQPVCYKACGNGRCDYCCFSPYMPTFCWPTQGQCTKQCHPPVRRPVARRSGGGDSDGENERS